MKKGLFIGASLFALSGLTQAGLIDFEDFGNAYMTGGGIGVCAGQGNNSCTIVGNEFSGDGVTLSFADVVPQYDNELKIVRVGGPEDAFVPNDAPIPAGSFGEFFFTTEFDKNVHFSLTFDVASDVSFDIADIDGGSNPGDLEFFAIQAFLSGGGTDFVVIDGSGNIVGNSGFTNGVVGDALVTNFSFADITRVEVLGTTFGGNRNIGFGLDNLSYQATSVPEPGTLALLFSGIAALSLSRKNQRAK